MSASLSTSPVELAKPPAPPEDSSAGYLTRWDSAIRLANFGELALAVLTLIFIRVRSSLSNSPIAEADEFPNEIDVKNRLPTRRENFTAKSDSARLSCVSDDSLDRIAARKRLLEHLKVISHYQPGRWFRADLLNPSGVQIRMHRRVHGVEEEIAETRQSDKLLAAVDRPDFHARLIDELIRRGFPIEKDKMNL